MRILFDTGHPSFVHLFKNSAAKSVEKGHTVLFSYRDKDRTGELLNALGLPSKEAGKHYESKIKKIAGLFINTFKLYLIAIKFRPDLLMSGASPYASIVCGLTGIKHVVFDDTENREQVLFYKLGSTLICTPDSFRLDLGRRHVKYPGLHELAYLPAKFRVNASKKERPLVFLRFVSWSATHDVFRSGLSSQQKSKLVKKLSEHAHVVISSETPLENDLEKYRYDGPVEKIHELLASADLYVGESATMASEAACLNIPAVYCDPVGRSYTDVLETNFNLVYNYRCDELSVNKAFDRAFTLLKYGNPENSYSHFSAEFINVADFIYWIIENYSDPRLKERIFATDFFKKFQGID